MSGNNRNIPGGTRDIMFAEAELYRSLETGLTELYKKNGFCEIMTPVIEYYDVFKTYKKIHDALAPIYNER